MGINTGVRRYGPLYMFLSHIYGVAEVSSCVVRAVRAKKVAGVQAAGRRKRALQPVPGSNLQEEGVPLAEADVLASLRGGLSFYEGLQVS